MEKRHKLLDDVINSLMDRFLLGAKLPRTQAKLLEAKLELDSENLEVRSQQLGFYESHRHY